MPELKEYSWARRHRASEHAKSSKRQKAKHVAQILKGMQDTISKCHPQTAPGLQAEPGLCGIYALSMRLKCGQNATCLALFDSHNMDLSRDHKHTTNTRKIIKMRQKAKHVAQILKTGARYQSPHASHKQPPVCKPDPVYAGSMRFLCGFNAVLIQAEWHPSCLV